MLTTATTVVLKYCIDKCLMHGLDRAGRWTATSTGSLYRLRILSYEEFWRDRVRGSHFDGWPLLYYMLVLSSTNQECGRDDARLTLERRHMAHHVCCNYCRMA